MKRLLLSTVLLKKRGGVFKCSLKPVYLWGSRIGFSVLLSAGLIFSINHQEDKKSHNDAVVKTPL